MYLYHVSLVRNLDSIEAEGLVPGAGSTFSGYGGHAAQKLFLTEAEADCAELLRAVTAETRYVVALRAMDPLRQQELRSQIKHVQTLLQHGANAAQRGDTETALHFLGEARFALDSPNSVLHVTQQ